MKTDRRLVRVDGEAIARVSLPTTALVGLVLSLTLAACATVGERWKSMPIDATYVAMGSSYAAGPGVAAPADVPPTRCARSSENYSHQLARTLRLQLTDVSCSGATTAHLLGRWNELAPQLDAVTSDTRLVTISIGGNNVNYVGGMIAAACATAAPPPADIPGGRCPAASAASEDDWRAVEADMSAIVAEIHRRAPVAHVILVDYPTAMPSRGSCPAIAMTAIQADQARTTARRLEKVTERVAAASHADLLRASILTRGHDACSPQPWMNGLPPAGTRGLVPFHPNQAGMTAISAALASRLSGPT